MPESVIPFDRVELLTSINGANSQVELSGKTMDIRDFRADTVRQLIADYLGVDASQITDEAHLRDDLGVDWLDQLELLITIEDQFVGLEFSDLTAIEVVGELIRHIESAREAMSTDRRCAA
jgi:acyl carrier protein